MWLRRIFFGLSIVWIGYVLGGSFVRGIMMIPEEGFPLRVYVGESDRHGPIYGKDSAFVRGCFDGG